MTRLLDIILVRFAIVGVTIAAIYVLVYVALLRLGTPGLWANGLAFAIAVAAQYAAQTLFTFRTDLANPQQAMRFAAMIGTGLVTSTMLTQWIAPAMGLPGMVAAIIVTIILPVQNYILMKAWVYTDPSTRSET